MTYANMHNSQGIINNPTHVKNRRHDSVHTWLISLGKINNRTHFKILRRDSLLGSRLNTLCVLYETIIFR
jgi:hypothetical protein